MSADFLARFRGNLPAPKPAPVAAPVPPDPKPAKAKERRASGRVPRTRNGGTMTEAAFWGMLRSGLRRTFRYWRPAAAVLAASKQPFHGPRGQRFAYLCAGCGKLHKRTNVNIDHRIACGALTSYAHLPEFVARLTAEGPESYQVLCKQCHGAKTLAERTKQISPLPG
jgi:hypothetical protein